jgi:hypothetical protein
MRMRLFFLGAMVTTVSAAAAMQACGGDAETTPVADAGVEASPDARRPPPEASAPDTGPECDLSGNFLASIPDASLADGATTSGLCLGCLEENCPADLAACNADCNCRAVVSEVLDCYLQGGALIPCALSTSTSPSGATQQIGAGIAGCIQQDCETECAVDELMPQDGGADADADADVDPI